MKWLIALLLLSASVAHAEDAVVQDIPPGDDHIVVVQEGKPAPFTGQLYSQETAMRWGNWIMQYKLHLTQDVKLERQVCKANLSFKDAVIATESQKAETIQGDLRSRILQLEKSNAKLAEAVNNPSFFRSTEFGLILGVVGSAAVAIAIGYAIGSN
jgi:hypothetical protein